MIAYIWGVIVMKPKIQELRKERGLMQGFVAKQMGISQQLLSDWEKGRTYPRIDKAYKLAKVLGVGIEELYEVE
jgi:putative transcriptional regulator